MNFNTDVLIIGTGIAGLTTALKLSEKNIPVTIITRSKSPEYSNTYWAQGGIIYSESEENLIKDFVQDIQSASSQTSSQEAAILLAQKSGKILEEVLLTKAKTQFNYDENGMLKYTREAAHSRDRIIFKGDFTGKEIEISMLNYLTNSEKFPNLKILTSHTAIDLITASHHGLTIEQRYEEKKVLGAYVLDQETNLVKKIMAKQTVLASGGIGALYIHNSNSDGARGDGHAMAFRAGAELINMEFIQFHPTTLYTGAGHRRFLISEAIRGEGGKLINASGEEFMRKYHTQAELAPRDVVSRAILAEMIETKEDHVYLDISHRQASWIQSRFPTIYEYCLSHKIDMTKEPIPVVPAAHYTCGGIKTNLKGQTSLKGLYAVGEVACTGLHGANRLASTALLEGLTFGYFAAEEIINEVNTFGFYPSHKISDWRQGSESIDLSLIAQDILTIKQTMWNYLGLKRSNNRLSRARAMIEELKEEINKFYRHAKLHDELIGLRNAIEVANLVLDASMKNKKSVGCFYLEN